MISNKTHIKSMIDDKSDAMSGQLTHRIDKKYKELFTIVEGKEGKYMNIRIKLDYHTEDLKLIMYYKTKSHYLFVFSIVNDKEKFEIKHNYFFMRKTIKEVEELSQDNHQSLIKMEQQITVILGEWLEND